ncbi:hypothetical protein D3C86_2225330 [compost metagenome]
MTVGEVKYWLARKAKLKTIGDFKALGRELVEKHNLTVLEASDILNGYVFNPREYEED